MENTDKEKLSENLDSENCGCGDGCCTPKKKSPWMKIIFIVVMVAAATIITIKLAGKEDSAPVTKTDSINNLDSKLNDTVGNRKCMKQCTDGEKKNCCPQNKD